MSSTFFDRFKAKHKAGQRVFRDGEIGTEMYIVQTGRVQLSKTVGGAEHILAVLEKGDFFGEMAVLENLPRTASATIVEDAELIAINGSTFDKMLKSNIEIAVRMLRKFSAKLRSADGQIARLLEEQQQAAPPSAQPAPAAPRAAQVAEAPAPAAAAPVSQPQAAAEAPAPAVPPAQPPVPPVEKSPIAVVTVKGGTRSFPILAEEVTIGRADPVTGLKPEIDLSTDDVNRFISRRHAKIIRKGGIFYLVEEVGVTNGTYHNGKRLQAGVLAPIQFGDELCFGKVFAVFEKPNV